MMARDWARLKTGDERLARSLAASRKWMDDMAGMYETLAKTEGHTPPPLRQMSYGAAMGERRAP